MGFSRHLRVLGLFLAFRAVGMVSLRRFFTLQKNELAAREQMSAWYQLHSDAVWKSLHRLGVPRDDLMDCTQRVFEIALVRRETFQTGRAVPPWLFGIAFRVAVQHRREKRLDTMELAEDAVALSDEWTPDESIDRQRGWEAVQGFLEKLPMEQRAVFVMHDIEGQPIPEIAQALVIPLNTAYSRLRLARAAFERFVAAKKRAETEVAP